MGIMESYSPKILEAYRALASYAVKGARGMPPAWPFSIVESMWIQSRFLAKEVYQVTKKLENIGVREREQSKMFFGPSALSQWLFWAQHGPTFGTLAYPFHGLSIKEGLDFLERVIDLISLQRLEDPFCLNQKNILLKKQEIPKLVTQEFIKTENSEVAQVISKINVALVHYCNLFQVAFRAYSQEFHGPYSLGDGRILFVRDYFKLKPIEVWDFASEFPYERIRILEIYKGIEIKVNLTNVYWASPSPSTCLTKAAISVDGKKFTNEKDIQKLFEASLNILERGNKRISKFAKKDWINKLIEMRYLWLKPMKEKIGEDWRPPSYVYDLVDQTPPIDLSKSGEIWRNIITNLPEDEAIKKITQMFLDNIYGGYEVENLKGKE